MVPRCGRAEPPPQRRARPRMEGRVSPSPEAEPGPEEVLRFLAERGGRARHAELVQHFRGALGGEPERRARARARFKELVNALATVRTDPVDGTKYVHLKRKLCAGAASLGGQPHVEETAAPSGDPSGFQVAAAPRVEVTAAPEVPSSPAEPESGELPGAASLEDPPGVQASEASSGQGLDPGRGASLAVAHGPAQSGGARRKISRRDVQPLSRASASGPSEDLERPLSQSEEVDVRGSPGGPHTPRPARQSVRDHVAGSSPQLKRGVCPGSGSPGGSSGTGRSRSGADSDSASVASSSAEEEGGGGGGSVTLDPLEHAWMLSASDGKWDSLEGLLACEPGLLAKRDFITGFTCLHWAAKHGRQELLAMLVNFANKHQLPVNINARSSGGYTALHLAAMHGHVEVVKLLVGAYDADVDIRDYSGRKASQYLSQSTAEEIRSLVGALDDLDAESAGSGGGGRWRLSKVLPSHLITYRLSHVLEDGGDHHHHHHHLTEGWAGGKAKDPGRKASSARIKPRLNKIRFRTQIIHTTPSFRDPEQPLEEGEEEEERPLKGHSSSFKLRPKSNVFG